MPDLSIVVPTYNEEKSIQKTIHEIDHVLKRTTITFEILIIDDNSPDNTKRAVSDMIKQKYPVRFINRFEDPGLSQSVVEGFKRARGNIIIVTDADLSHDITSIPEMYKLALDNDIVIGSRYCKGGKIVDWPIKRKLISYGATFLARILFPDIKDPVSGFFAVKKDLVENSNLKPRGYKILLEILGKTYWHSYKEIPYTFTNRKVGDSKLKTGTMIDYMIQIIDIIRFPTSKAQSELKRILKFGAVGILGILVNTIILGIFKEWFDFPLIGASFIAIELSILFNFLLNDNWSFKEIKTSKPWLYRMFSYNGLALGGMIINIAILIILTTFGIYYLMSNLIGILCGFAWNFISNRRITWKKD